MNESRGLGWPTCVCNVGVQRCGIHPRRLRSKEERIAFRKKFDEEVENGRRGWAK